MASRGDRQAARRLQVRAAVLYYREGATQQEIAGRLGISRATAGRVLASARVDGVVRIEVVSDLVRQVEVELALEKRFGLSEAVVVEGPSTGGEPVDLGAGCADLLLRRLGPGSVLGLGWSSFPHEWIAGTAEALRRAHELGPVVSPVTVVQLAGAAPEDPSRPDPRRNVSAVAEALDAEELLFLAPLYVDGPATVTSLSSDRVVSSALRAAEVADVCMFAVGHVTSSTPLVVNGYLAEQELAELRQQGAVGDVVGRFYDADGCAVPGPLANRTLSTSLEVIATRPLRVAVAGGSDRTEALRGALAGGLANAVVTDATAADGLLSPPHLHPRRT